MAGHFVATAEPSAFQHAQPIAGSGHLMPVGADARLFCSLVSEGHPADEVEIMNARLAGRGKNAAWLAVRPEAASFAATTETLKMVGNLAGMTFHDPFRPEAPKILEALTPRSRMAGMADVARRLDDGRWEGDLVAVDAFRRTLRSEGVDPKGARVWLIGAGGSATAAALCLAERGISSLTVVDQDIGAALALGGRVRAAFPRVVTTVGVPDGRSIDIAVDGARDGRLGQAERVAGRLRPDCLVVDAVVRREIGPFAETCLETGLSVVAGDCLLVHLLALYDEFFGWSRIPYKDASLGVPFSDA